MAFSSSFTVVEHRDRVENDGKRFDMLVDFKSSFFKSFTSKLFTTSSHLPYSSIRDDSTVEMGVYGNNDKELRFSQIQKKQNLGKGTYQKTFYIKN